MINITIEEMIDLYGKKLKIGLLDSLCRRIRKDAKKIRLNKGYCPKGVCAGGIVKPLAAMNSAYPIVFVLQLVLNE